MNFLVDAPLPRRMIDWFTAAGCNAIHTLDLPDGNRTTDEQVNEIADREQRAVASKEAKARRGAWGHAGFLPP
jgi:predicted nuclease of predicted toxin-antitoxin system